MKKRSIKKLSLRKAAVSNFNMRGSDSFNTRFFCHTKPGQHTCGGLLCETMQNQCHTQQGEDPLCMISHIPHQCETLIITCNCGSSNG